MPLSPDSNLKSILIQVDKADHEWLKREVGRHKISETFRMLLKAYIHLRRRTPTDERS